jgi:iron-sulfur cluster repair protein YtfE (RIC family)
VLLGGDADLTHRFQAEHRLLRPDLSRLLAAADHVGTMAPERAVEQLRSVHRFLAEELLPHEDAEEHELYPVLDRVLGGDDPTGTMIRAHVEIRHLIRRLGRIIAEIGPEGPDAEERREARRLLYGLHAVLVLHFAQEDEGYLSLADDPPPASGPSAPPGWDGRPSSADGPEGILEGEKSTVSGGQS